MLEPKAPPARNGPNTGGLAPGVRRRVNKKIKFSFDYPTSIQIKTLEILDTVLWFSGLWFKNCTKTAQITHKLDPFVQYSNNLTWFKITSIVGHSKFEFDGNQKSKPFECQTFSVQFWNGVRNPRTCVSHLNTGLVRYWDSHVIQMNLVLRCLVFRSPLYSYNKAWV